MVWVVVGTLQSPPGVTVDSVPSDSSHWLRPNRRYRAGRQGGLRAPPKPGSDKAGPVTKARLYDFRIASLKVSKEGLIDFETGGGDWVPEDRPNDPRNLEPYPLVATVRNKKFKLARGPGQEPVPLHFDESGLCKIVVQDGDYLEQDSWHFKFTWVPVIVCFPAAKVEQKTAASALAKSLGIKVAYGETLPHHTHYDVKKVTPNKMLLTAAARPVHIVSPTWFEALRIASKPPDRPTAGVPPEPEPQQPGEDTATYDKRVQKYERDLLALDPDVGSDASRWWGHSFLEKDWEAAWPTETDPKYCPAPWNTEPVGVWKKDERRRTIFRNVLMVSFSGALDADEKYAVIVQLAGGHFFATGILQRSPLPADCTELVDAIAEYKVSAKVSSEAKIVILPPSNLFTDETQGSLMQTDELDEQSLQQRDLLLDLQEQLGAAIISSEGVEIATALSAIDASALLGGPSRSSDLRRAPSSAAPQSSAGLIDPTPPFPTGGVPGTHPDSVIPTASMLNGLGTARGGRATETQRSRTGDLTQGQASGEAGPSQPAPKATTQPQAAPATAAPKKLVRRARTGRTAVLDLLDDPDDEAEARSAAPRYLTQDLGAVAGTQSAQSMSRRRRQTESPAAPDAEEADSGAGSSTAPSRTGRLSRRAGQKSAVQAFFDDDGDAGMAGEGSGSGTSQSGPADRHRTSKTKEERMREIREEDERRAKEEADRYKRRKVEEEKEAQASKGGRNRQRGAAPTVAAATGNKRDKSAALSGDDDNDSDDGAVRQPSRKLASKKGGDAPLSTTNKRTREMSRAAEASSSSDEGGRGARKKSTGPVGTDSPKSKKEAAAQKKAAKEAAELDRKRLLQVKTSKRKGAEIDKELNDDFNALKIVKPVMKSMPPVEKHRMAWDEEDSDAERDRLIRADQERAEHGPSDNDDDEMDPNRWRQATQAMFVVRPMQIEPKARRDENDPPRDDPRWAGKANFKRFRPKNGGAARAPAESRPQIKLVLPDAVDYGLGEGYGDRKGALMSQIQQEDEDEDADIFSFAGRAKGQAMLDFGSKTAAAGKKKAPARSTGAKTKTSKSKGKQAVSDSEEDSDADSSHTLDGDDRVMDIDELDDEATPLPPSTVRGKRGTSKGAATGKASAGGSRKIPTATIMIDDSDSDSDSGLTFRGFGKKGAGASSARR
ncbi:hypothetical protein JCM10908_005456 [Rhodotorula pacifica]|uniref:uncharacterized protein n=1 Tax=Rhodotorula pacifica TaxID=1495444 RepID=UPI003170A595